MNYKVVDIEKYYRKDIFQHFEKDVKCSVSMTYRIDVTKLIDFSKRTNTKFYINFLYVLSKVLNSREDYRLTWKWQTSEYGLDAKNHPNWFDASFIPWISYDALHLELPDGYLHLNPIINWGAYREENGKYKMPVSVRLNHAAADGYLVALVFRMLEREMEELCEQCHF